MILLIQTATCYSFYSVSENKISILYVTKYSIEMGKEWFREQALSAQLKFETWNLWDAVLHNIVVLFS